LANDPRDLDEVVALGEGSTEGPSLGVGVLNQSAEAEAPNNIALAQQIRAWFAEAWGHPMWEKYRRDADEDMGFYIGGDGQWSYDGSLEDLNRIKKLKKAHVSINHVQSVVDVLTGFERQNRYDLKASPMGDEDVDQANLFSMLMKHEQDKLDAPSVLSECFENGTIQGASCVFVGIDWSYDPLFGDILIELLVPGQDVLWDPTVKKLDFSDGRFVFRWRHATLEDLCATYPEHAAKLRAEVEALDQGVRDTTVAGPPEVLQQFDRKDGYGGVLSHPLEAHGLQQMFYSGTEKKLMVVECWYRDFEEVAVVADKESGRIWEIEKKKGGPDPWTVAKQTAAQDDERLTAIRRKRRKIRMALCVPATYRVLEEDDSPYDNDSQHFPFAAYIAKKKQDVMYGVVRNLKDPQRVENHRESQALDILSRFGNIRRIATENTLANPRELDDQWSSKTLWVKSGAQPPGWDVPPMGEILKALFTTGDRGKLSVREVSGINTDLLGIKGDDASGIAIARRQAQGQTISTVFFDNYRQMKRNFGRRLAKRIQQVYSYEKTVRLTSPTGEGDIVLKVNPAENKKRDEQGRLQEAGSLGMREQEGNEPGLSRPKVLRDVSSLDYDILIAETPATPTMRSMALLALLEIIGKVPGIAPALMDIIVDLSDIPDRDRVKQRVMAMMKAQGLIPPEPGDTPPGQPGPGGPPPGGGPSGTPPPDAAPGPSGGSLGPPPGAPAGGPLPMAGPGGQPSGTPPMPVNP
jgi:hypothetical protein